MTKEPGLVRGVVTVTARGTSTRPSAVRALTGRAP